MDEAHARLEKASKAAQAEAEKRDKENASLASQVAELQSRLDDGRDEQQAELATMQSSKSELEVSSVDPHNVCLRVAQVSSLS